MFLTQSPIMTGTEIAYMRYDKTHKYLHAVSNQFHSRSITSYSNELNQAYTYMQEAEVCMSKVWNRVKKYQNTFDENKHPIRFSDGTSVATIIAQLEHADLISISSCTNAVNRGLMNQGFADQQRGYTKLSHSLFQTSLALDKVAITIHQHLYITGG